MGAMEIAGKARAHVLHPEGLDSTPSTVWFPALLLATGEHQARNNTRDDSETE